MTTRVRVFDWPADERSSLSIRSMKTSTLCCKIYFQNFLNFDFFQNKKLGRAEPYDRSSICHHAVAKDDPANRSPSQVRQPPLPWQDESLFFPGVMYCRWPARSVTPIASASPTKGLMDKELAYDVNGSVYFRVSKHGKYGTLACLDASGMEVSFGKGTT